MGELELLKLLIEAYERVKENVFTRFATGVWTECNFS